MRVTTMAVLALDAASPHRVDQVGEDPLSKHLPLSLQHLEQMLAFPGRGVVLPGFAIQRFSIGLRSGVRALSSW